MFRVPSFGRGPVPAGPDSDVVLRVQDVSVRFGGVTAVDGLTLSATAGEVTGLIGPNGAGKTTSFNVITGLEKPTSGQVHLGGIDVSGLAPYRRARLGMARTFQRLEVFGSLTARGNILAAAEFHQGWAKHAEDPEAVTEEILDLVGIRSYANDPAESLPTGLARLVELGRALATRPRLLLLDEPGSGLNTEESDALGALLLRLAADGMAILLVEHDVELVMRVCASIQVLDFGRPIAHGTPAEIQANPDVQQAYLGVDTSDRETVG